MWQRWYHIFLSITCTPNLHPRKGKKKLCVSLVQFNAQGNIRTFPKTVALFSALTHCWGVDRSIVIIQMSSSSVPSRQLLVQHFLNILHTMWSEISFQVLTIHRQRSAIFTLRIWSVGMRSWSPSGIHSMYIWFMCALNGLFKHTSRSCSTEVILPGIITRFMWLPESRAFITSVLWLRNEFSTSIDLHANIVPGLAPLSSSASLSPGRWSSRSSPGRAWPLQVGT